MSRKEIVYLIEGIQSLIDIDTFFEKWEDVRFWRMELLEAKSMLEKL